MIQIVDETGKVVFEVVGEEPTRDSLKAAVHAQLYGGLDTSRFVSWDHETPQSPVIERRAPGEYNVTFRGRPIVWDRPTTMRTATRTRAEIDETYPDARRAQAEYERLRAELRGHLDRLTWPILRLPNAPDQE